MLSSCKDGLCIFLLEVNAEKTTGTSEDGWLIEGGAMGTEWLENNAPEAKGEMLEVTEVTEALASDLSSLGSCPMAWRARLTLLSSSSWLRKADRSGSGVS